MEIRVYSDASVGFAWHEGSKIWVAAMAWKIKRARRSVVGAVVHEGIPTSNIAELMGVCLAVEDVVDQLDQHVIKRATLRLHTDNEYAYKMMVDADCGIVGRRKGTPELLQRFAAWSIEIRKDRDCGNMAQVDQLSRAYMKAHRATYASSGAGG